MIVIEGSNNRRTKIRRKRPETAKNAKKHLKFRQGHKVRSLDVSLLLFLTPK